MTIKFSKEELEWIDKKPFRWSLKKGCPKKVRESIKQKLDVLNAKSYSYEEGFIYGYGHKN